MSVSLLQLRTAARQRADMVSSQFVTDAELTSYVNASAAELYDILTETFQDYYSTQILYTIPNNSNVINLPSDFYKLRALDLYTGGIDGYYTLRRTNLTERNRNKTLYRQSLNNMLDVKYIPIGNTLYMVPESKAPNTYRLWYIPRYTNLVLDADVIDDLQNWQEYIVVDCAIKMMQKEESDVSILMAQKAQLHQRIQDAAQDRDAGLPERVSDSQGSNGDDYYGWIGR